MRFIRLRTENIRIIVVFFKHLVLRSRSHMNLCHFLIISAYIFGFFPLDRWDFNRLILNLSAFCCNRLDDADFFVRISQSI